MSSLSSITNSKSHQNIEEILEDSVTWAADHPMAASLLALGAYKMGSKIVSAIKNRKGSNLFIELDLSKISLKPKPIHPFSKFWSSEAHGHYYLDIVDALRIAADDKAVAGVIIKLGVQKNLYSLSTIFELREALKKLKSANKKLIGHFESFGENGENIVTYLLASICDEIHVPHVEVLKLEGLFIESMFFRKLLEEKLGVEVLLLQREGYKNFVNTFTKDSLTPEHYEQLKMYQTYIHDYIVPEIAKDRGMSVDAFKQIMNEGLISAERALELNLITHVGYRDSAYTSAASHVSTTAEKLNLMFISQYFTRFCQQYKSFKNVLPWTKTIAVVHLHGAIASGSSPESTSGIYSEDACRTLRALRMEKNIAAVILHIDSPGGSATASDAVYREICLLKESGKKIIVFQSSVAASGGYWLSAAADLVVATPLTITGSIGVVFGKLNLRKTFGKIGITFDNIEKEAAYSSFLSTTHSWSDEELRLANDLTDGYYDKFKNLVSETRGIPREQVDELAQGKIYFGNDALKLRLVDHVGDFYEALRLTKLQIGVPEDGYIRLINYPPRPTLLQMIFQGLSAEKSRNTREHDELRRKGLQVSSMFTPYLQSISRLSNIQQLIMSAVQGSLSPSQFHSQMSSIGIRSNSISSNVEAYSDLTHLTAL